MVVTQPAGFLKVPNNCATNSSVLSRVYSFFKSSWSRCGQRLSLWFGIDDNTFILVRSSSDLIWFRWDFNNGLLTGRGCVDAGRNNRRWCVDNRIFRLHTTCFYTPDKHRRVWRLWRRDQTLLKNNKMNKESRTRTDNNEMINCVPFF